MFFPTRLSLSSGSLLLLMSVVTPRYLNSEWCTREAREFCQTAEQTGGLVIGNKSRVFKVIKTPVDDQEAEALPAHMKDLIGFEFFAYKDGAPLELDPDFGPEYSQLYKQKVALLAQDIAQLLKALQAEVRRSKSDDAKGQRERAGAGQTGGVSCRVQLRPKAAEGAPRRGAEAPRLSGSAGSAIAGGRGGICRRRGEHARALRALDPSRGREIRRRARWSDR